jgi:hypothetical protein
MPMRTASILGSGAVPCAGPTRSTRRMVVIPRPDQLPYRYARLNKKGFQWMAATGKNNKRLNQPIKQERGTTCHLEIKSYFQERP